MGTWVIEATEFKYEVIFDLKIVLRPLQHQKVAKMALRVNLQMDNWVIEVAYSKCDLKFYLGGLGAENFCV